MFDFIRTNRRFMQFILLVLILPAFALGGVEVYLSAVRSEPMAAIVGKEKVTLAAFNASLDEAISNVLRQRPAGTTIEEVNTPELRKQVLNQLINQLLVQTYARDEYYSATDEQIVQSITADEMFIDPSTGQFSTELYQSVLQSAGFSAPDHQAMLRASLSVGLVDAAILQTSALNSTVKQTLSDYVLQDRETSIARFPFSDAVKSLQITDEKLQNFYEQNKQLFTRPDQVSGPYILVEQAGLSADTVVTEADAKQYYESNQKAFSTNASRHVYQIQISLDANASPSDEQAALDKVNAIRARLIQQPDQFSAIASTESQDILSGQQGGDLGWIDAGSLETDLDKVIFSLKLNEISDVVRSSFGFHILKVVEENPGTTKSFESVKEEIINNLKLQQVQDKFSRIAQGLTDLAYDDDSKLEEVAAQLGLEVRRFTHVGRKGEAAQAIPGITDQSKVLEALFSPEVLNDGRKSGVITLDNLGLIIVSVDKFTPSHTPPFDEIKQEVIAEFTYHEAKQLTQQKIDQIKADIASGKNSGAHPFTTTINFNIMQSGNIPLPIAEAISKANVRTLPAVTSVVVDHPTNRLQSEAVLIKITAVKPNQALPKSMVDMQLEGLNQLQGSIEREAFLANLQSIYHVEITPEGQALIDNKP